MFILFEADEITSIMINYPALLLRKKSNLYPEGRTSYRFKKELRREVTVHGTSVFTPKKKKKAFYRPCELDIPETDEPEQKLDDGEDQTASGLDSTNDGKGPEP